jgi:hypothetical protein
MKEMLGDIVKSCFEKAQEQQKAEGYIKLERGFATIPLTGIDVPFHSRYLWAGVLPFCACMLTFSYNEFTFELIFLFQIYPRKSILVILTQICLWVNIFPISLRSHSTSPASTLRSATIRRPRRSWTRFLRSGNRRNGLMPKTAKNLPILSLSNSLPINSLRLSVGSRPRISYSLPSILSISLS